MSNTLIAPGEMSPDEIVRHTNKGIFVKKMGGGQVNTVNGDFVFEVSEGYLIENEFGGYLSKFLIADKTESKKFVRIDVPAGKTDREYRYRMPSRP